MTTAPARGAVERFDRACDRLLEPLRRVRAVQAVSAAASTAGDFSVVWHTLGIVHALTPGGTFGEALFLSAVLGAESLVVNQGVKRMFRRERPTASGDERFAVRTPSTSSFPSGHASSATVATMVLVSFAGWPAGIPVVVIGVLVAASRVMVRIHHASDIVGGIAVGALLGTLALTVAPVVL